MVVVKFSKFIVDKTLKHLKVERRSRLAIMHYGNMDTTIMYQEESGNCDTIVLTAESNVLLTEVVLRP